MKNAKFKSLFVATTLALGLGAAGSALAIPQFQVDPDSNAATLNNFYATSINGNSSERLTINAASVSTNFGYMDFTGFTNGGPLGSPLGTVPAITTGLGNTYGLYLTFNLVANYVGGGTGVGTVGSNYQLSSLNFSVYQDVDFANAGTRTLFSAATLGSEASISQNAGDSLLGSGSLVVGVAGIDALGGAFLNSTTTYANTAAGNLFFVDPNPFYDLAFNAFNNSSQGVAINGTHVAISATGLVDFNRVPEPATLALLGMGLIGMGVSLRKRKAA